MSESSAGGGHVESSGGRTWITPPNWPVPHEGWTPPPGWQPDPAWGPPPEGWQFWREDPVPGSDVRFFGARKRARELAAEVQELRSELGRCHVQARETEATIERLGLNSALEAEDHRARVEADIAHQQAADAARHEEAVRALDSELQQLRANSDAELRELAKRVEQARSQTSGFEATLDRVQRTLIAAEAEQALQEVGLYGSGTPCATLSPTGTP